MYVNLAGALMFIVKLTEELTNISNVYATKVGQGVFVKKKFENKDFSDLGICTDGNFETFECSYMDSNKYLRTKEKATD